MQQLPPPEQAASRAARAAPGAGRGQPATAAARAVAALRPRRIAPAVLAERVRACLGRVVSHPGAISVSIEEPQEVVLRGAVLAWEREPLLRAVRATAGVRQVCDELAVHESAEPIGALLTGRRRGPRHSERPPEHWSPGVRLLAALAGGGLLMGTRRRGPWGALGAAAGGVLLLRSLVNAPLRDISRGRSAPLELRRSLRVHAPLAQVFAALRDGQWLASVLANLREVRRGADGSSHWVLAAPGGVPIEWDAVATQIEPDRLLAWRTLEHSRVQHWGMLRFEAQAAAQTLVHLYVSYQLPGGRIGQVLADFLGADPDGGLSQDLARLQAHLEAATAQGPAIAAAPPQR